MTTIETDYIKLTGRGGRQ